MRILVAVVVFLLVVSPVSADGIIRLGWPDAVTTITDHGDDAPDTMVRGQTYTVTAWMRVASSGKASAGYRSNGSPVVTLAAVTKSAASLTMNVGDASAVESINHEVQEAKTGTNFSVSSRLVANDVLAVSVTFRARGNRMVGSVLGQSLARSTEIALWNWGMITFRCTDEDEYGWGWMSRVVPNRTSEPVSEHVVFHGFPKDSWWCDLYRIELDGTMTQVPPLQPANQIVPAPWVPDSIHCDLMVHGNMNCDYVIVPHRQDGYAYPAYQFTVYASGSKNTTEVSYGR